MLRTWLDGASLAGDGRLPPERDLAASLGVSRAELRKALAVLEGEGRLSRHIGRGTFLSGRACTTPLPVAIDLAHRTSPPEVMQARLVVEPEVARLAAFGANAAQVAALRRLAAAMRAARAWAEYEELDWRFHDLIAEAAGNRLLVEVVRLVNGVRRAVVWGHLARRLPAPAADYHSFDEHDGIVAAIANRDRAGAALAMLRHLRSTAQALEDDRET